MPQADNDWIIGRKAILDELKLDVWLSVISMKKKDKTMPVGKVGG